ncbi:hypothetical protein VTO73DRAFT_6218 [Trametes versicolor]
MPAAARTGPPAVPPLFVSLSAPLPKRQDPQGDKFDGRHVPGSFLAAQGRSLTVPHSQPTGGACRCVHEHEDVQGLVPRAMLVFRVVVEGIKPFGGDRDRLAVSQGRMRQFAQDLGGPRWREAGMTMKERERRLGACGTSQLAHEIARDVPASVIPSHPKSVRRPLSIHDSFAASRSACCASRECTIASRAMCMRVPRYKSCF